MSTVTPILESLAGALSSADAGVVGLVNNLLHNCREQIVQLDWQGDRCRVFTVDGESQVPLRKSVFRAILVRLAVLCNERRPDSVSPYGGKGELAVGNPERIVRVSFVNSADEQRVELRPVLPNGSPG